MATTFRSRKESEYVVCWDDGLEDGEGHKTHHTCHRALGSAFGSTIGTVLCDHGTTVGTHTPASSHCSGDHSYLPAGVLDVKCALDESEVHAPRFLWLHMKLA